MRERRPSCRKTYTTPRITEHTTVETFRVYSILTTDWRQALSSAIDTLDGLPRDVQAASGASLLISRLRQLLQSGLKQGDPIIDEVADHVATLLQESRIPGIPRPEDERWEFD
jgi:hypothetical protein